MSGPTTFFSRLAGADYAALLGRLLPRGRAWNPDDPGLAGTLAGLGEELARVHNRLLDLLDEGDVETATELLDGWDRVFDMPDPCDPSPAVTVADRRVALHAKLVGRGGSQPALVRAAIEALGYASFEIQIPTLFRTDESATDERLYDLEWTPICYVWAATTPSIGWDRLLCFYATGARPAKPAHSLVIAIDGLRADEVTTPT